MKCPYCGYRIKTSYYVCPKCGAYTNMDVIKKPNILLCILSVIIPPIGCMLALFNDNATPKRAKVYMRCALCGIIMYLLLVFTAQLKIKRYLKDLFSAPLQELFDLLKHSF